MPTGSSTEALTGRLTVDSVRGAAETLSSRENLTNSLPSLSRTASTDSTETVRAVGLSTCTFSSTVAEEVPLNRKLPGVTPSILICL